METAKTECECGGIEYLPGTGIVHEDGCEHLTAADREERRTALAASHVLAMRSLYAAGH